MLYTYSRLLLHFYTLKCKKLWYKGNKERIEEKEWNKV